MGAVPLSAHGGGGLREFRDRDEILPPGAHAVAGTLAHQALAEQTPEGNLRAWVEGRLEHVQAVDKDRGSKLEELPGEYLRAGVHARRVLKRSSGRLRSRTCWSVCSTDLRPGTTRQTL